MGQKSPTARTEPGIASLMAQLDDACALLRDASGEPFRLIGSAEQLPAHSTELAPGWVLAGGPDSGRREAAATLLGHLLGAEREIESLCAEILDRYEEVTLIQRLGLHLARAVDEDAVAQVAARELTDWLHAGSAEIWLRDGDQTRLAATIPTDHATRDPLGELGLREAMSEGEPWNQEASSTSEAVVAVPLPAERDNPLGLIVLRGKDGNRSFEQREVQMLTAVAALLSGFLRSQRLARQGWLQEHDGTAGELSELLHPRRELAFSGLDLACGHIEGQQPGSDYFDVVSTPDGGIALNLARVSTGGVRAAVQMALAKGVMQAEARNGSSPGSMLQRVNDVVSPELIRSDLFATAHVARFHPGARRVDFASAGHAAPLLFRPGSPAKEIEIAGPALGLLCANEYRESTRDLEPGDLLLFYTDGLIDARNKAGNGLDPRFLGELLSTSGDANAEEVRERLLGAFRSHCEGLAVDNDATLIVARVV